MTDTAKQITSEALDDGGLRQPQQDAAPSAGKLPALKVPDPEFLLRRLSAGKSAGLLSRQKRSERVGQPQALVNEVAPKKFDAAYIWAVVTQGEPMQYESFAAIPERLRAGFDEFTREEFAAEKALWYLPLTLAHRYDKPLKLKKPPAGRRFGADVDLETDIAKAELPNRGLIISSEPENMPVITSTMSMANAIITGQKPLIVKPRVLDLSGDWLLISNREALGVVRLGERTTLTRDEFKRREAEHLISEATRAKWAKEQKSWDADTFYGWPVKVLQRFDEPRPTNVPAGPQTTVQNVELTKAETPADVLSQARDLAGILASRAPGFFDKTLRFVTGPAATVTFLKGLPGLYQALDSELGKVKLKQREAGKPAEQPFVQMTEELSKLLRKLRPLLPDGAKRARALIDDAIKSFDAFVALSRRFGEAEDRPVVRKSDDEPELVENVLVPGIGSVPPAQIDPKLLADLTDEQVQDADLSIHRFFRENFAGTDRTTLNGDSREDVVNAHIHVLAELAKRKMNHPGGPDELDVETRALEPDAYASFVTKRDTAMVHAGRAEDFDSEITLDEVTPHYRDIVLRSPAVYIVGGLAVRGRTAGDIDVLIREPLDPETKHAVKFRLGRALPPELSKRVSFLDDASGGPYCLSGDRVVGIKVGENLEFRTLEDWWVLWSEACAPRSGRYDSEILDAPTGAQTLAWGDGRAVWASLRCITRKIHEGEMVLLRQRWGQTEVTTNHSVYDNSGELRTPFEIDELLALRSLPDIPRKTVIRLPEVEEPTGRWALKRKLNRDYGPSDLPALLRFLASYVSDGHSTCGANRLVIQDGDYERLLEVAEAVHELWGIPQKVQDRRTADDHTSRLIINRRAFGQTFARACGQGSINKHLPSWIFNLPPEDREYLLNELVKGDGNIRVRNGKLKRRYYTSSPVLLAQISALHASLGRDFAIERNGGSPWTRYQGFCLADRGISNGRSKIRRETRTVQEHVYDLSCEGVHNFVDGCGLIVVHNTDHVELYDLVLRRRSDLQVKRMALEIVKQGDPLMDLPPIKDQRRRGVWHYHLRGKSLHADLRMHTGKDYLTGWTVLLQKTGAVPEVNTVAEGRRIARDFSAEGSRYTKPFLAPANVRATSKSRQPMAWLEIEDQVIEPGQVGATRLEEGVIVTVDEPQVEWGLQKPFAHEYFLTGKGAKVTGILFFRLLTGEPGAPKEEVEAGRRTPAGEAFWVMKLTKSLLPSVLKPRAVQTESIPPFGYPAIPKTLAEVVPKQYQYWTIKNDRERREIRDALVASKFFTEDNIRIVDGEFRKTVTKRYLYVPDETELAKQPAVVPFVVSWQWWKGQEVVRGGPSRQVWHLMLDTAAPGLESWILQSDPLVSDRSSAIQTPRKQKDLLDYEGDVEPGQRIGGDVLNETKATPSGILIKDRGRATLLEDGESFKKIRFTGKSLRGTYVLIQEEAGSPIWTFAKGTEPGRRIPAEKLDDNAEPQSCDLDSVLFNDALQMYAEKAVPVRDGVQHWDPKRKDPDADRTQLKPLAIFQPQKGPSRETNMFRGDEVDRVLEDFATSNVLRDGVFVEPKYNGFRVVAEKSGERVIIFTEDEKRDITPALPSVAQELKAMPGDFVLDGELNAFEPDGTAIPRRELAPFRGTKPTDDSGVRLRVVEALFLPKHGNITAEIYEEVRKRIADYLKGQKLKHVEITPAKLAKTEAELRDAIKWASKQPASEGAMLKFASATYSLGGENDGWAKIKIAREIKALVYDKHPVKDSPGVYNYFGAVGPVSRQERDQWEETVKIAGKWYVPIGKTANTKQQAKIGDTVRVEATEILIDRRKDKASMRWFGPVVVVEVSDQKPMTPKDIEDLALPGEVEKRGLPTFDVEVLKFDDGERYVEGVVLQPTDEKAGLKPDAQKDIYSEDEIRKALHFYMESGPRFKDQHGKDITSKIKLLEIWQTRAPYTVGNRTVAKGTWVMCLRILDKTLWDAIRSGQRTGFSIGGVARREAA